jgi:DNA-binding NtrC family response regulator
VQRVGSLDTRHVDVHVIAASNRDLRLEVEAGRFRLDLYHRLNVTQVHLQPLRNRREDIPRLADSFTLASAARMNRPLAGLTEAAVAILVQAPWTGNVRELRNVIERACILADGHRLTEADVREGLAHIDDVRLPRQAATVVPMPLHGVARLAEVEREHIATTLAQVQGNKAVAARLLGISRRAFYRQLERHGLHQRSAHVKHCGPGQPAALERAS